MWICRIVNLSTYLHFLFLPILIDFLCGMLIVMGVEKMRRGGCEEENADL